MRQKRSQRSWFVNFSALALFILIAPAVFAQQQWSMGYYTPNSTGGGPVLPPASIEFSGLTHVVYWGGIVHSNGTLDLTSQQLTTDGPTLIAAAHANGVKVIFGLLEANWLSGDSNTFLPAITNNLTTLVSNVMSTVNTYGFDGVDIDWEQSGSPFAGNPSGTAMLNFLSALRTALGTKLLTVAAMTADYPFWGGAAKNYVDRISVMTYDLTGTWNPYSWHNAALYSPSTNAVWSVDLAYQRFTAAGVPAAKLNIGIPFYGWQWSGGGVTAPDQTWTGSPTLNQIYYNVLMPTINTESYNWDSAAQVPYASSNTGNISTDQFITYDNAQSVAAKVSYAQSKGLGGWIIWELVGDYFPSQTPNQPLLDAIRVAMGKSASSTTSTTTSSSTGSQSTTTGGTTTGGTTTGGTTTGGTTTGGTTTGTNVFVPTLSLPAASLPSATQDSPYTARVNATGGVSPYSWSVGSGALPAGVSIAAGTGIISGMPATAGTTNFTVTVTDSLSHTATETFSIAVSADPNAPFALWTMDQTSGSTASDSSGNNNTVALSNSPTWLAASNCMIIDCLSFNGTNQAGATQSSLNLSDTNVVTVAFWMYWNGYSNNDALAMESTSNFNNSTTGFMIDPNSSSGSGGQFEAGLQGNAGYNQILFARPSAGAWHHYVFVFNKGAAAPSQVTPYVDGVAVAYTKTTSALNTNNFGANTLYLMSRAASSLFGAGRMDDVRIYKRALSAFEVQTLATGAGPFAEWKMNATSGNTATDASGNGNNLALVNSPAWLSGASCQSNDCLAFNGGNQAGSTAALDLSDTNIVTVTFWMYWNGYSSNDSLAMESTANFNDSTTGFMIDPNSSQGTGNLFEAGLRGDAGYNQALFPRPTPGAWHHYAIVFNKAAAAASQIVPYVDGAAVGYAKPNSALNTNNFGANYFSVMGRDASSLFGAGRLEDLRIYKRPLSATEIQTLASQPAP